MGYAGVAYLSRELRGLIKQRLASARWWTLELISELYQRMGIPHILTNVFPRNLRQFNVLVI